MSSPALVSDDRPRWRAYARLVRLPNVFTAVADIGLGGLACWSIAGADTLGGWVHFLALLSASACFYMGGMVWNDYFDRAEDGKSRPERPIPSGRVAPSEALRLGALLIAFGLLLSLVAGVRPGGFDATPVRLALVLAATILLYDRWLKHTAVGPIAMGLCRFLNVQLGLTLSTASHWPWGFQMALCVGLYTAGITWFARTEERDSQAPSLIGAALLLLMALGLALLLPVRFPPGTSSVLFPYLLVVFGFVVGLPVCRAIQAPTSARVRQAVGRAVLGIIGFDALLAMAVAGAAGLLLLVLLVPAVGLARRFDVT